MRLVSAYRGVPWAVLVDGGTCKPTWSNGGFALSRFVPECALTHCEARPGICSAPLTIRSQHSAPLAADRGVRTATPALRHARTLLEALPAVSALAAAASASAAPDLKASGPMRVPSTGSSKAAATAPGARCKPFGPAWVWLSASACIWLKASYRPDSTHVHACMMRS